ncbi:MAG: hypothetical protein EPO20_06210 [Betaproteobacteria bacterium]|nr:MAG: hypothetical protein EPO20_06210 [Betaproteobacteria bacterium]
MSMQPWYRNPWPWILMAGPAAVLVAGAITTWMAVASSDGLVADDYYRQGLAINKVLAREDAARALGISADIAVESGMLKVKITGQAPEALFAQLVHATRAGYDQRLRLAPAGAGVYEAELPPLPPGHWRIVIEDPRATWRIVKESP